jgi:hypothetical protein
MSEREATIRTAVVTYFPMFIAALSLITSIFNGYLNSKFVDLAQHNVSRAEDLKACKEIIEAYFQVKFRIDLLSEAGARSSGAAANGVAIAQIEAGNAVNKFAALGTYLANLRGGTAHEQYTHVTWELEKIVRKAAKTPPADVGKLFEPVDPMFSAMNDDCIKAAKQ